MQKSSKNIYGLIIAAGLSSRMGAYKPLLNYKGKSLLQNIVLKLNLVCKKIIVVTGFRAKDIRENLSELNNGEISSKIEFILNREFEKGMFSSLQKGSRACSGADWILYHFVDQPSLPYKFYTNFVKHIDDKFAWIQPVINNKKGHPVLFSKEIQQIIIRSSSNFNLKEISHKIKNKKYWQCDFKQILHDIDNADDYKMLLNSN